MNKLVFYAIVLLNKKKAIMKKYMKENRGGMGMGWFATPTYQTCQYALSQQDLPQQACLSELQEASDF